MSVDAILQSFELAAERAGDILPATYEAYFARCPESRELMRLVDTHMRGRMMESVLQLFMAEQTEEQLGYLQFETRNHVNYGVLPHMYGNLLSAVRDTVRDACADDWTQEMDDAWRERIAALVREIEALAEQAA
jgi:hemoglobin-like flavoprotein